MSSKYPHQIDLFELKRNATFDGDPNGDYVMAEDINNLQDAIVAMQETLGTTPQGLHQDMGTRIGQLEGTRLLRIPPVLIYLGDPLSINGSATTEEAVGQYLFYDHVVLGNGVENPSHSSHGAISDVIAKAKQAKPISFYGYIDCGTQTSGLTLSQIQSKIHQWLQLGVDGIYCANIGYESGVNRSTQNTILGDIHHYGMTAILSAQNPDEILGTTPDPNYNGMGIAPDIRAGDSFHIKDFGINTVSVDKYEDHSALHARMTSLLAHRKNTGVRLLATPTIQSNISKDTAQDYYNYAHALAVLYSVDGFYPVIEGYGVSVGGDKRYAWAPIIGQWQVEDPQISLLNNVYKRTTGFGEVIIDASNHTYAYNGIEIPSELISFKDNSLDGSAIKDGTITDDKIAAYDGTRLISSINSNADTKTLLSLSQIEPITGSDISGDISKSQMEKYVVDAINDYTGKLTINAALIGELNAEKITSGNIETSVLEANVVNAINASIDELNATHAVIDQAAIGTLDAEKITAGDIAADRIRTNVVSAINAYAQNLQVGDAVIKSAAIDELTSDHIKASVITAINTHTENAYIKGATIEDATITEAKIKDAAITSAKIKDAEITTAKIALGAITTALIDTSAVGTAQIADGSITNAKIVELDAGKITAGTIDTAKVTIQGDNGHLKLTGNRLQVFDDQVTPVERVSIGDVNDNGTIYGFRVRGADGTTVLYDETGVYNEGITDGAITNPKIGDDAIDGRVIAAESIVGQTIVGGEVTAGHIAANAITGNEIAVGAITAGKAIIAEGAIGHAQIASVDAGTITVGKVSAKYIEIGADTTFSEGYDPTIIRSDLNLTAPLPTEIEMNGLGIKATSALDNTQYVQIDGAGLTVSNGAISIIGGLKEDNIDSTATSKWNNASNFADEYTNDDLLTPHEKTIIKRRWNDIVSEYDATFAQADYYFPDDPSTGASDSPEKTTYENKYGALNTYLNVTPDSNNNLPILDPSNMNNNSSITGSELETTLAEYATAKANMAKAIAKKAKDLADAAQQNIDDVENNIVYKVEITSTNGLVFKNGQFDTVLEAKVYHGSNDVTNLFPASRFKWTRVSQDAASDASWNAAHSGGTKTITITPDDIYIRATFNCEILEE